jgi:predicted dienelactone hydrolase
MPGFRSITVPAAADDPALRGAVWYPCAEAPAAVDLGNVTKLFGITVTGAKDAPITGYMLPLVVVSHGRRSHLVMHHDLAETLADGGFIVAAINHAGDNYFDQSRSAELSVMLQRPTEIKRLIDFMLTASPLAATIDRERIGVFGFSRGGHTGLALLGANPDWAGRADYLWKPSSEWQKQVRDAGFPRRDIAHDPRIRAGVIADPLAAFFTESSFADVAASIQLWASERGGDGVTLESVAAVGRCLPTRHESHVVCNAGHFAFLIPCRPALAKVVPEICIDPPEFDRPAFHKRFNADVLAFFQAHLVGAR